MNDLRIGKYNDFDISINSNFELVIKDNQPPVCRYPLVVGNQLQVEVPEHMHSINDFLAGYKQELTGEDVKTFLRLAQINVAPFIWSLMQDKGLDIFINKKDLYIHSGNTYVVLNNQNMDFNIINRLYQVQGKPHSNATYCECQDDLYTYIRNKISNSIGHNDFINIQIKDYKKTEMELEKECRKEHYDFPKILMLYEKLIRIKEDFLNENHHLMPQKEVDEIYHILQQIRVLLKNNSSKYHVRKV